MAKTRSAGSGRSIALILSYIFDWIVIMYVLVRITSLIKERC